MLSRSEKFLAGHLEGHVLHEARLDLEPRRPRGAREVAVLVPLRVHLGLV